MSMHEIFVDDFARCGNAVCPPIPTALVRANLPDLCTGNIEEVVK